MAGLDISSSKRPANLSGIDDRDIVRDMREWATAFEQMDNDLKAVQANGAKLMRMNRELNAKVHQAREARLPPAKDKPLKDLLERTVEFAQVLTRFVR